MTLIRPGLVVPCRNSPLNSSLPSRPSATGLYQHKRIERYLRESKLPLEKTLEAFDRSRLPERVNQHSATAGGWMAGQQGLPGSARPRHTSITTTFLDVLKVSNFLDCLSPFNDPQTLRVTLLRYAASSIENHAETGCWHRDQKQRTGSPWIRAASRFRATVVLPRSSISPDAR